MSFQMQFQQFDRGSNKYCDKLGPTTEELIEHVNQERRKRTRRKETQGLGLEALELVH